MKPLTSPELKNAIRTKYAWPGGYPMYLLCGDGGALCMSCGRAEYRNIIHSIRNNIRDGWNVVAVDVNWECTDLMCDHCNEHIESAYGE